MRRPSLISVGALVVAVTGGVLLTPESARACKCVGFQLLAPADGQTDVPPNTKLWLVSGRGDPTPTFALAGPDGDVPVSVMELGQIRDLRVMITPAQELTPGATYQLRRCLQQGVQGLPVLCEKVTRFTVGSLRVEQPPLPVERSRSEFYRDGSQGSCGPSATRLVEFKLDWQGLLLLADIDGTNPYPADPGAVLFTAISDEQYAQGGRMALGTGPCISTRWASGDTAQVRFGAVNLAGEFSGWSQPTAVTLPEGGCQMGGGGRGPRAPWPAAGLGIALLWLRRRFSA